MLELAKGCLCNGCILQFENVIGIHEIKSFILQPDTGLLPALPSRNLSTTGLLLLVLLLWGVWVWRRPDPVASDFHTNLPPIRRPRQLPNADLDASVPDRMQTMHMSSPHTRSRSMKAIMGLAARRSARCSGGTQSPRGGAKCVLVFQQP